MDRPRQPAGKILLGLVLAWLVMGATALGLAADRDQATSSGPLVIFVQGMNTHFYGS